MSGFQQAFAKALLSEADASMESIVAQPGFAVYRNTVAKGCVDALEANFPTVVRLVGGEWFHSVALAFALAQPPHDSRLLGYGDDGFPAFLREVPTAAGLPWLADVARLDALWRACHAAADARVLDADSLAGLAPEVLGACVLRPHPAARWPWFDDQPIASIWWHNRGGGNAAPEPAWQGEGLLFTRPDGAVRWQMLSRASCAFLDACDQGCALGEAAQRCLEQDAHTDLAALLQQLLQAGAFTTTHLES
jgi:hypothetical protein